MSKKQTENRYAPAYYKKANSQQNNAKGSISVKAKKLWTIVAISLALIIAVTASLCVALHEETIPPVVSSEGVTQGTSNTTISNSNFKYTYADGQNLQYPLTANDWTVTDDINPREISMGVVDTADWDNAKSVLTSKGIWDASYNFNPLYPSYNAVDGFNADSSRIYMIAKKSTAESDPAAVTSASFTVASGSYLKITVYVKVVSCDGNGLYMAIKDSNASYSSATNYLSIYDLKTAPAFDNNGWAEYNFYVAGDKSSSKTLYLELGMGRSLSSQSKQSASGIVFFGGIDVTDIHAGTFSTHIQKEQDDAKSYMSYSFDDETKAKKLAQWDKELLTETYDTISYDEYIAEVSAETDDDDVLPFTYSSTGSMYKMVSTGSSASLKFAKFSVNPPTINKCYRLSFWIRTKDITKGSGAYIYLNAYDNNDIYKSANSVNFTQVNTPKVDGNTYVGWSEYSFYIQPSETDIFNMELEITIGLRGGQEDMTTVSGTIYLTELYLYELDYTEFSSASAGNTVKTLALKSSISTDNKVTNGSFNNTKFSAAINKEDNEDFQYPIDAASWSELYAGQRSLVENYDKTKLAPNKSSYFNDNYSSIGGMIYQGLDSAVYGRYLVEANDFYPVDDDAHAALMIYNKEATAHGYTSAAITLDANSYYRFSVLAKGKGEAVPSIYLTDGGLNVLAAFTSNEGDYVASSFTNIDKNINGTGYNRYYVYVATGNTTKTVYLELWLGNRDATGAEGYQQGTVLFDQAQCLKLSDTTELENEVSEEYQSLFEAGDNTTAKVSTTADITKLYTEEQTITSTVANLKVIDYRFNDAGDKGDLQRVIDFAKPLTEITTELTSMISTFNTKYYQTETEGTYYIDLQENNSSVKDLRVYLNKLLNPVDDTDDTTSPEETEPIDWIVLTSLIVTVAMLGAIVAIIIRKFAKNHKKQEEVESNYSAE